MVKLKDVFRRWPAAVADRERPRTVPGMTPDELRYNGLVVLEANVQRLVVMHNSAAHIAGRPVDPAVIGPLHGQLDVIGAAVQRADQTVAVEAADVELVRPFAAPLLAAVRAYFETDLSGPPATRAGSVQPTCTPRCT